MQTSRRPAKVPRQTRAPDSHGQAALLFAESILHGLIEKGLLTNDDAIVILAVAMDAKEQIIEQQDEPTIIDHQPLRLLERISKSLELDCRGDSNTSIDQGSC